MHCVKKITFDAIVHKSDIIKFSIVKLVYSDKFSKHMMNNRP